MSSEERFIIAKGSKSFYLASLFFSNRVRIAAWMLYRWCRYCDDQIDMAKSHQEAELRLVKLQTKTLTAIAESSLTAEQLETEFLALRHICQAYAIPQQYPLDLIAGLKMDVDGVALESLQDVELYGYRVAGVVGLMMTHVFGASSEMALKNAVDMGVAMQLTNIARDIHEDHKLGRCYLPRQWLRDECITASDLLKEENSGELKAMTKRLLLRADALYDSGYEGLQYLPLRAALAVSIAASIYSYIGKKVLRNTNPGRRVFVTLPEKLILVLLGSARVLPLLFHRALKPWTAETNLKTWCSQ